MVFTCSYISATDSFCLDYSTNFLGLNSIKEPDKDTTSILVDTVYTVLVQEDIAPARPPPPRDKAGYGVVCHKGTDDLVTSVATYVRALL